jgi:hypothetical protein
MRKKLLNLVLPLALFTSSLTAQNRLCSTMEHLEFQKQNDPGLVERMANIENHTNMLLSQNQAKAPGVLYTIPVVVHVVYRTASENISDAQIQSQMNILNADFRKLNSDISLLPSAFSSLAADAQIEFCLAQRDPSGNASTGIVRKSTTTTSFSSNNAVKYTAQGGDNAWDATKYLNIWVCNLGGGLLGYAQFPGGAAATDGVVCNYTAFGNTGTAAAPFNKGRTATHEVGHWLNLRHIWGDANCGNDQVSDTPTQQTANYGCPSFPKVTCSNGPNGDLFMNYMDYTDDACMYMFTTGQKNRMLALFATGGAKASLATSNGCTPPSGGGTCATPASLVTSSITSSSATLSWAAVSGATSYTVDYKASSSSTWTSGSISGTSASVSGLAASTSYDWRVLANCSSGASAYSSPVSFSTSGTSTGGNTITVGTGTATSTVAPYGTYYMDQRAQYIVTAAELSAAGYTSANSFIKSLAFNCSATSGQVMNSFTIKIAHTSSTAFSNNSNFVTLSSPVTVFTGNVTAVSGWNTHTFTTNFPYNGTSSIIVDICWNNSTYTTNNTVLGSSLSAYRSLYKQQDVTSGSICTTSSGTRSYTRPNMRLNFVSTAAGRYEYEETSTFENQALVFELYPNPTNSEINLNFTVETDNSNVTVTIIDMMGRTVGNYNLGVMNAGVNSFTANMKETTNFETLANGIYILNLNVDGKMQSKRFVLNK